MYVPRGCYATLGIDFSVYIVSPCLTGPNPPTKWTAISTGEFRCTWCYGPFRAPALPLALDFSSLVTLSRAMIAEISTVPRRESTQYRVRGISVALGAAPARRRISPRQIA